MRSRQLLLWMLVSLLASGSPVLAQGSAEPMAAAAADFLQRLDDEGRERASMNLDGEPREDWHFIPKEERKGLPLKDMRVDQGQLAHALLASSLSRKGYGKTVRIMSLEKLLFDIEMKAGPHRFTPLRLSDGYYFTVFGDPRGDARWGWSVEGHHVSLNYTVVDGQISSTPAFFGANPHEVSSGPGKGLRVLAEEEDLGRSMLASLDDEQRSKAIIGDEAPRDIFTAAQRAVEFERPAKGLAAEDMTEAQRAALEALIELYIANVPAELAAQRRDQMKADFDSIRFAWMGPADRAPGNGHYYRVQAPSFLIEYDNVQGDANHSHTVWRDYEGDFGRDLLREHREAPH